MGVDLHGDDSLQHALDYCEKAIEVLSFSPIITEVKKAYIIHPKPLYNKFSQLSS